MFDVVTDQIDAHSMSPSYAPQPPLTISVGLINLSVFGLQAQGLPTKNRRAVYNGLAASGQGTANLSVVNNPWSSCWRSTVVGLAVGCSSV